MKLTVYVRFFPQRSLCPVDIAQCHKQVVYITLYAITFYALDSWTSYKKWFNLPEIQSLYLYNGNNATELLS